MFRDKPPYLVPAGLVGLSGGDGADGGGVGDGIGVALDAKRSRRRGKGKAAFGRPSADGGAGVDGGFGSSMPPGDGGSAEELFMALRSLRKRIADEAGVPPYVVFPDRTLKEMAVGKPLTEAALASVYGVGRAKLQRYGAAFLELLTR
jgi:superfamily II DNA helicase RecQ